ncbi:MAG: hypothetical protein Q9182_001766 [Xanthomendoza sp. 2 TL-2023]
MSITLSNRSGIRDGRYVAIGVCHNCKDWHSGSIDFESTTQPMSYAVGPDKLHLNSDAPDAGLRRHDYWGKFSMDLQAARGDPAGFPPQNLATANTTMRGNAHNDHEYTSSLHAVAMAGTFVLIFPAGTFYKTVMGSVRWHWITQAFGLVVVLVGAGLGLAISPYYNQASLGSVHHRIFKAKGQPTIMGVIHRFLGLVLICVGVINGVLGFNLASASHHNIGYAIVVLIVVLILFGLAFFMVRRRRRQEFFNTPAARNFQSAYNTPSHGNDIPLRPSYGAPPAYQRPMGA